MFSRLFSVLITGDLNMVQRTKAKILVSILLVALTYCFIAVVFLDTIRSEFPNLLLALAILGLLILLKVTQSVRLVGNLLVSMIFLSIAATSFKSGGIYSHDLPSLCTVVLISFCILGIKETVFYCIAVLSFITYSYYQGLNAEKIFQYNQQRNKFQIEYYFVISCLMVILPTIFYSVLSNLNSRLINDLSIANKQLDKINNDLASKGNKLIEAKSKLEESNQKLERYAHAASHDLKQPLRTIISFTQLIERKINKLNVEDDSIGSYIEHVINGTKRMESQVEDLLSFSSVNQDGYNESIDLNKLVKEVQLDLGELISKNKVSFNIETLPIVIGNRSTIAQVFQNLISNAIKYCQADSDTKIHISSESFDNKATICVADNGCGIKEENLSKIFDPYFQEKNLNEGHGIGLDTCKQIIESHGGQIWADSKLDEGSKFCFSLPMGPS